jgi:hypothetical protein
MNSFFTWYIFLEVGKTRDLPSKFWQTLGDAPLTMRSKTLLDLSSALARDCGSSFVN